MSAVADEVSVMKDGLVVESGPRARVLREPAHAYTRSLLASLPDAHPDSSQDPLPGSEGP
jgi:peptide/nickel transport system ATP-binding protein